MTDHATKIVYEYIKQQNEKEELINKYKDVVILRNIVHVTHSKDIDKMEKGLKQ